MADRQFRLLLLVVVVSGLIGGMLSDRLIRGDVTPAAAEIVQLRPEPGKETLVVRRLVIQDEDGNMCGSLDALGLHLRDPETGARAELEMGDGETVIPRLSLSLGYGEEGGSISASVSQFGAHLIAQNQGQCVKLSAHETHAGVNLLSKSNDYAIQLRADQDGDATVILEEADGQGSTGLRRLTDGRDGLYVSDSQGRNRLSAQVAADGEPFIELKNGESDTIWSAP